MARSDSLRQEVSVMSRLERAMADLPDDRARTRVADWFAANFIDNREPAKDGSPGKDT
jgi:hypothetical protein